MAGAIVAVVGPWRSFSTHELNLAVFRGRFRAAPPPELRFDGSRQHPARGSTVNCWSAKVASGSAGEVRAGWNPADSLDVHSARCGANTLCLSGVSPQSLKNPIDNTKKV